MKINKLWAIAIAILIAAVPISYVAASYEDFEYECDISFEIAHAYQRESGSFKVCVCSNNREQHWVDMSVCEDLMRLPFKRRDSK